MCRKYTIGCSAGSFRHAWLTLGMAAAVLLSTVFYAGEVKRRMMSCSERDQFAVEIYLPKGTGLAKQSKWPIRSMPC